jgi:HemY protein
LAAQAQVLTPDLATPAAHHARSLLQDGRSGPAAKAVERAWRTAPHPELVEVYGTIRDTGPPLVRVKNIERLAAQNPVARESYLALAEAALDAQLWGEARRYLEQASTAAAAPMVKPEKLPPFASGGVAKRHELNGPGAPSPEAAGEEDGNLLGPTPRLCLLMARLEEAEHASSGGMRKWLDRAVGAMPDPRYICASCGGESVEWRSLCPHCGSFDTLAWRTPAWAAAGRTLRIAAEPRSTSELPVPELPVGNPTTG